MASAGAISRLEDAQLARILFHLEDSGSSSQRIRAGAYDVQSARGSRLSTKRDVASFRLVSRRLNNIYMRHLTVSPPPVQVLKRDGKINVLDLPSEIHDIILDYLVNYDTNGQLIPIAKKSSLSVESFTLLKPQQNDTTSIANYVCAIFRC